MHTLAHFLPGETYLARDILQECDVAVKLESTASEHQTLEHEYYVMKTLGGGMGVPSPYWFGQEGSFNAIVFDCLGPSLQDLYISSRSKFSTRTVSAIALQMVCTTPCFSIHGAHLNYADFSPPIHPFPSLRSPRPETQQYPYGCWKSCKPHLYNRFWSIKTIQES